MTDKPFYDRFPPQKNPVHVHVCIIDYYTNSTCNIYTAEIRAPHQNKKKNNNHPKSRKETS